MWLILHRDIGDDEEHGLELSQPRGEDMGMFTHQFPYNSGSGLLPETINCPAALACPEHRVGMFPWPEKALRQRVAGVYTGRSHRYTSAVVGAEGTWAGHTWHLLCLQLRTVATAALAPQRGAEEEITA